MIAKNICFVQKRTLFGLVLSLLLFLGLVEARDLALDALNDRAGAEVFARQEGQIIYTAGQCSPKWAIDAALDEIGITKGYGTGGIDPYKFYTRAEFRGTLIYWYLHQNHYNDKNYGEGNRRGYEILQAEKGRFGADVIKKAVESSEKQAARKQYWKAITQNIIPSMLKALYHPIFIGFVVMVIVVPLVVWHGAKAFFAWVFVRRPTILGPNDSDVYKNWFSRLRWRSPNLPPFIANAVLQKRMRSLVTKNKRISRHNKNHPQDKIPYAHVLGYGDAGVGKTLFAKSLAKKTNMHFMYFSVGDLAQLPEEEALQNLKELFAYARAWAPCIIIVDECDRLFAGADEKTMKLGTLFQKEFASAVNTHLQLFLLTNYPWKLPLPILNRISPSHTIHFDNPNFSTQKKLFSMHLKRFFSHYGKKGNTLKKHCAVWIQALSSRKIAGLVGRDIEAICADAALKIVHSLSKKLDQDVFLESIEQAQKARKELESYRKSKLPKKKVRKKSAPPEERKEQAEQARTRKNWITP